MSVLGVRRGKAAFFSGCKSHPATIAPAGSNRSRHGGDEMAEASGVEGHELVSLDFRSGSRLCENDFLETETKVTWTNHCCGEGQLLDLIFRLGL